MATIEQLKTTIADLKTQLATAETQLQALQPAAKQEFYAVDEEAVLALAEDASPSYKKAWRKLVTQMDLVENVQRILEECRDYFLYDCDKPYVFTVHAKRVMGQPNSKEWADFTLQVIKLLKIDGAFGDETNLDNFEDTAGGCDEVTQDAAIAVIEAAMAE
jgi:hypothetical protein